MCGIVGVYTPGAAQGLTSTVAAMLAAVKHRGPDSSGMVSSDGSRFDLDAAEADDSAVVCIGHGLLSIVGDASDGRQPVVDPRGQFCLAYNGEVHNYIELRSELASKGHRFATDTDTEVVMHAYAEWGIDCFQRFNGMWAIAVFDLRRKELILSRDRFGIKPLYYVAERSGFRFASEMKALFHGADVRPRPNWRTLYRYLAHNYRWVHHDEQTFYDDVFQVPAASLLVVDESGRIDRRRYWDMIPGSTLGEAVSDGDAVEMVREMLLDSVRIRMRSDAGKAVLLSGGVDSASIACMAAVLAGEDVNTVSARFTEPSDEGPYIEETRQQLCGRREDVLVTSDQFIETLTRIIGQHDTPLYSQTWLAHWNLMQAFPRNGWRVALTGHGADELLGGYRHHRYYRDADSASPDSEGFDFRSLDGVYVVDADPAVQFFSEGTGDSAQIRVPHSQDVLMKGFVEAAGSGIQRPNVFRSRGYLKSKLYQELMYETVPIVLGPEDVSAMAFGVEARHPFLDHRLVELSFSLPDHLLIRGGTGKWVLREAMRGIVPDRILDRREKQGMNVPVSTWLRDSVYDSARELLTNPSAKIAEFADLKQISAMLDGHRDGTSNSYLAIWQWINAELWLQQVLSAGTGRWGWGHRESIESRRRPRWRSRSEASTVGTYTCHSSSMPSDESGP